MAEIKMDISEYNEIMEGKNLLKESLKREKELAAKIESLNKEKEQASEDKIKAYEEAKHNVILVHKIINEDKVVCSLEDYDSDKEIFKVLRWYYEKGQLSDGSQEIVLNKLRDTLFDIKTEVKEVVERVESHDYEQAISAAREAIEQKYLVEISEIKELKAEIKRLKADNNFVSSRLKTYEQDIQYKDSKIEELNKDKEELNSRLDVVVSKYESLKNDIINIKFNIFNSFKILKKLISQAKQSQL